MRQRERGGGRAGEGGRAVDIIVLLCYSRDQTAVINVLDLLAEMNLVTLNSPRSPYRDTKKVMEGRRERERERETCVGDHELLFSLPPSLLAHCYIKLQLRDY